MWMLIYLGLVRMSFIRNLLEYTVNNLSLYSVYFTGV